MKVSAFIRHGSYEKYELIGSDVILFCNATGNPLPKIEWELLGKQKIKSNQFKYTVYPNMLLIKIFDFSDIGIYKCSASNGLNKAASINATLKRGSKHKLNIIFYF